jgi:dihydroflavonol-4-reductase
MTARILITGASGLIGSHILLRFSIEGLPLRAVVRNKREAIADIRKIASLYFDLPDNLLEHVEFVEGDLTEPGFLQDVFESVSAVVHAAGMVSFRKKDCARLDLLNNRLTADLANEALEKKISWFCHISSVAAFGKTLTPEIDETVFWKQPVSPSCYAISKYGAEREVWRAYEEGLPVVIFCPTVVAGPSFRQGRNHLANVFSLLQKNLRWYLPGQAGYVDARDVADAVWFAYRHQINGEKFILNATHLTHRDFLAICADASGLRAPKKMLPLLLQKTMAVLGGTLHLAGIDTVLPDKSMLKVITGSNVYKNNKFIERSGLQYRDIRAAVKLMALVFEGKDLPELNAQKPGW